MLTEIPRRGLGQRGTILALGESPTPPGERCFYRGSPKARHRVVQQCLPRAAAGGREQAGSKKPPMGLQQVPASPLINRLIQGEAACPIGQHGVETVPDSHPVQLPHRSHWGVLKRGEGTGHALGVLLGVILGQPSPSKHVAPGHQLEPGAPGGWQGTSSATLNVPAEPQTHPAPNPVPSPLSPNPSRPYLGRGRAPGRNS